MNFGLIKRCMVFGSGQLLADYSVRLNTKYEVIVVTSLQHSRQFVEDESGKITLKEYLIKNNIEIIISEDIDNDENVIEKITAQTLGISFGAVWIFKKKFIDLFKGKLLNLHPAKLPQDRGGGGFSWRILRNDRVGVCVIHQIDAGVDSGDIVSYEEFFYPYECRLPVDYEKYTHNKYKDFLNQFFDEIEKQVEFEVLKQPSYSSTYFPKLYAKIHGYINWDWNLRDIELFICAFDDPHDGARTFIRDKKVILKKCYVSLNDCFFHPFQKGFIFRITKTSLFVATEQGTLIVNSVLDEDGSSIIADMKVGERFHTPLKYLESAKKYRAVYSPTGIKHTENYE